MNLENLLLFSEKSQTIQCRLLTLLVGLLNGPSLCLSYKPVVSEFVENSTTDSLFFLPVLEINLRND